MMIKIIKLIKKAIMNVSETIKNKWLEIIGILPKVKWVVWEATVQCNSRCQMCDIWRTEPADKALSFEEAKKVFNDPLLKNIEVVLLTGGEPILRSDLLDIVLYIHKKIPKARITLSTNGLLADKVLNFAKTALENGVCLEVGVSLDGIGEHHDIIRGVKGNFQKVDYLIDQLLILKGKYCGSLSLVIGQTLIPATLGYIGEVKQYAEGKGVEYLAQLYDESAFYHNEGKVKMSQENINVIYGLVEGLKSSFHNEMLKKILKKSIIKFDCFALRSFLVIRYNGDIASCLKYIDKSIGNVRNESLSEIWRSQKARERRSEIKMCQGCANTWATDWSKESNFLPFTDLLVKTLIKRPIR